MLELASGAGSGPATASAAAAKTMVLMNCILSVGVEFEREAQKIGNEIG